MASPTCRAALDSSALRPVRKGHVKHQRLPKAMVDQGEPQGEQADGGGHGGEERPLLCERRLMNSMKT